MSKCADFTIKANNKPLITIQAVVENIYSINEVESVQESKQNRFV